MFSLYRLIFFFGCLGSTGAAYSQQKAARQSQRWTEMRCSWSGMDTGRGRVQIKTISSCVKLLHISAWHWF